MDKAYLALLTVRKENFGTGFEGYLVGNVTTEDEAITRLVGLGMGIWDAIYRLHKHSYAHRKQLEKVIRGESSSVSAIEEWAAIFGAELARQRAQLLHNPEGQAFRSETKRRVEFLPAIEYQVDSTSQVRQSYVLPKTTQLNNPKKIVGGFTDREQLAVLTVQEIGKFGHPLLRAAMQVSHL